MDMTKEFKDFLKVYYGLIRTVQKGDKITYGEIAQIVGLPPGGIGQLLGKISRWEKEQGRPMLSAVVVGKKEGTPGDGFFDLAEELNKLSEGGDKDRFWQNELDTVYAEWG